MFHGYGHEASCQVGDFHDLFIYLNLTFYSLKIKYNPRRLTGFGLVDGEGIERLWSYMRPFSRTTKQMTPSHRVDNLVAALNHFGRKKAKRMGNFVLHFELYSDNI